MVIIGTPVFVCFKRNGAISLGGCIYQKKAFHAYLGRLYTLQIFGNINKKIHYVTGLCTYLSPMSFSQVNFHKYDKVCCDLCSASDAKTCYCFSKICKAKILFFTNIPMARNSEKKNKHPTIQLQYKTT